MSVREQFTKVLIENGVDTEGGTHSWRCFEPERFPGYCRCIAGIVDDVVEVHERALAEAVATERVRVLAGEPFAAAYAAGQKAAKPRTLTADDPEPAVGSVVLDRAGHAWTRGENGWWSPDTAGPLVWVTLLTLGPLRIIHYGGHA